MDRQQFPRAGVPSGGVDKQSPISGEPAQLSGTANSAQLSGAGDLASFEALAEDLASEIEAELRLQNRAEARELRDAEAGRIELADLLRAAIGARLTVTARDGDVFEIVPGEVAQNWLLGKGRERALLVPLAAIARIRGPLGRVGEVPRGLAPKLSIGTPLRAFQARRARVRILHEIGVCSGHLRRVGADWIEVRDEQGLAILTIAGIRRVEVTT